MGFSYSKLCDSVPLTTVLENYAKTCENLSISCKQKAELAGKAWVHGDALTRNKNAEVKAHETEAAVWEERAKIAKEGYLLVDTMDSKYMLTNGPLIGRAARESRVRYVGTNNDNRLGSRAGMTPTQPGTEQQVPGYQEK
jgi:hypothetical protein